MKLQQDLLATFRDDFYKYGDRFDPDLLFKLFVSVCRQIGAKFIYSQVDPSAASPAVKKGLVLLCQARVFSMIRHTSANGLPLGAESNDKFFKILVADTGLVSVQLDLSSIPYPQARDLIFTNKGPPPGKDLPWSRLGRNTTIKYGVPGIPEFTDQRQQKIHKETRRIPIDTGYTNNTLTDQ